MSIPDGYNGLRTGSSSIPKPRRREAVWKRVAFALLAVLSLLGVYGALIEPRWLEVRKIEASLPNLPPEWEGQRIAVLADWQIGMWGANTGTMRKASERAASERPAAVLLVGDFMYKPDGRADELTRRVTQVLRPLVAARIPSFAVLGNHDYSVFRYDSRSQPALAGRLQAGLERIGIPVLTNQVALLRLWDMDAPPLYLVGVGSNWAGEARPAAAVAQVPTSAARVVFMHNPNAFDELPAGSAPLTVAAHTHGGQVRIFPGLRYLRFVPGYEVHTSGWIDPSAGQAGNRLYVNRGLGMSSFPIRINARPELTLVTLRRGPVGAAGPGH